MRVFTGNAGKLSRDEKIDVVGNEEPPVKRIKLVSEEDEKELSVLASPMLVQMHKDEYFIPRSIQEVVVETGLGTST